MSKMSDILRKIGEHSGDKSNLSADDMILNKSKFSEHKLEPKKDSEQGNDSKQNEELKPKQNKAVKSGKSKETPIGVEKKSELINKKTEQIKKVKQQVDKKVFNLSKSKVTDNLKYGIDAEDKSRQVYQRLCELAKNIFDEDIESLGKFSFTEFKSLLLTVIELVKANDVYLLESVYSRHSVESNYLIAHSVSSLIYSVKIALSLGWDRDVIVDLGVAAFLHDIGMKDFFTLVNQAVSLTQAEYEMLKHHALRAENYTKFIKGLPETVNIVAKQHHERYDGSGYPDGTKKGKLHEFSKIVAVVDVFVAMIHPRVYRDRFISLGAIEALIEKKDCFSKKIIKCLINYVGIYPVGSMVELNTGEKAKVLYLNNEIPLRPIVCILYDSDGDKMLEPKTFDLTAHPTIYIKKAL